MKKSVIVILIILLLIVLGVAFYLYRVDNSQKQVDETLKNAEEIWNLKNEESELQKIENEKVSINDVNFDSNKMKSDSTNVRYEETTEFEPDNAGLKIEIQDGKPYLSTDVKNPQYQFLFSDTTETVENKELTGFKGNVIDTYFAYMGNGDMAPYILFLMDDGTVEFINSSKMLKSKVYESKGKVEELSNIVKFVHLNAQEFDENGEGLSGWITVAAIDGDGYSFDLSASETLQKDMLSSTY